MKDTRTEYSREYRADRKRRGICLRCKGKALKGCVHCSKHRALLRGSKHQKFAMQCRYRRQWNITYDEYLTLKRFQKGRCAACNKRPVERRLAVDHDHQTKMLRGLLCSRCNMVLGHLEDSIQLLLNMIAYLSNPPAVIVLGKRYAKGRY
jgi:recombination endonuclease VII